MEKLNLYQRLAQVRKSCAFIKKAKIGENLKFPAVSSSMVLYELHDAINEAGLILIPEIISEVEQQELITANGGKRYLLGFKMAFTWVNIDNPEDKLIVQWVAKGLNTDPDKCLGVALTYAEKYFLLKFFNIATDKDDPDGRAIEDDNKKVVGVISNQERQIMAGEFKKCITPKAWADVFAKWVKKYPYLGEDQNFKAWAEKLQPRSVVPGEDIANEALAGIN